jgi:hypothetical protein
VWGKIVVLSEKKVDTRFGTLISNDDNKIHKYHIFGQEPWADRWGIPDESGCVDIIHKPSNKILLRFGVDSRLGGIWEADLGCAIHIPAEDHLVQRLTVKRPRFKELLKMPLRR